MREITLFQSSKYDDSKYNEVEKGIYEINGEYVISMCFVQEIEFGEGTAANDISQYPLEDILDRYFVYVSDFYRELNTAESKKCYLEFKSKTLLNIQRLKEIIGKHVYNKRILNNGQAFVELVIE